MLFLELPITLVEDICHEAVCSGRLFDACHMREVNRNVTGASLLPLVTDISQTSLSV
jgi:hypothetical protein